MNLQGYTYARNTVEDWCAYSMREVGQVMCAAVANNRVSRPMPPDHSTSWGGCGLQPLLKVQRSKTSLY